MAARTVPSVANALSVDLALKASARVAMAVAADAADVMRAVPSVAVNASKVATAASSAVSAMPKAGLNARLPRVVLKALVPKERAHVKPVRSSVQKVVVRVDVLKVAEVAVNGVIAASAATATVRPVTPPSRNWPWPTKPLWLLLHVGM